MDEHRKTARRRVLKGAIAAFNARHSTTPCTVRDISDTGCRLLVGAGASIPDTFELIIDIDGIIVPCEVIRRTSTEVGVRFIAPIEHRAPTRKQVVQAVQPPKAPSLRSKGLRKPDPAK